MVNLWHIDIKPQNVEGMDPWRSADDGGHHLGGAIEVTLQEGAGAVAVARQGGLEQLAMLPFDVARHL